MDEAKDTALITAVTSAINDRRHDGSKILIRDNTLIKAIYTGSVSESKILLQALYDFQKTKQTVLCYSTEEIAECIGIPHGKAVYPILHKAVSNMLGNQIVIHDSKKHYTEGFVVIPYCSYGHGVLTIELNKRILPYLTDIKNTYTAMDLRKLQNFGGERTSRNFGLRLYEILRTNQYMLEGENAPEYVTEYMSLEELKLRTGLVRTVKPDLEESLKKYGMTQESLMQAGDIYPAWKDFKKRVLEPALKNINTDTHLRVEYEPKRVGSSGKIVGLTFRTKFADGHKKKQDRADTQDNAVALVRTIIKEPLNDNDITAVLCAAGGDVEKVRNAYALAEMQAKEGKIRDLTRWMIAAIKGGWSAETEKIEKDDRCGEKEGGQEKKTDHYSRYGFNANKYDMDELEKELLAGSAAQDS